MDNIIKRVQDFNGNGSIVQFYASVLEIKNAGNKDEKKPIQVLLKLEETGENFLAVSWNFEILDLLKSMSHSLAVAKFEGTTSIYKDTVQIKLGKILETLASESKKKKLLSNDNLKDEIKKFISENIKDFYCLSLLETLILKNDSFFQWCAAKKIHHNFRGGLAKHSLNVAKLALAHYNTYKIEDIDKDILLTGALLHDIGKLEEYDNDEIDISFEGNFIPHLVSGVILVDRITQSWIKNDRSKKVDILIKHIIESHHDKLEYGSPIVPKCLEASIVSICDLSDSRIEAISGALLNTNPGSFTENQIVLGNSKVFKWEN